MFNRITFFIILLFLIIFTVSFVSADDLNETTINETDGGINLDDVNLSSSSEDNSTVEVVKTSPVVSVKTTKLKAKDTLTVYLKNSSGSLLKSKNLTLLINGKKYSTSTNSNGIASLNLSLPAKTYKLIVSFACDDQYKSVSKKFNIKVSKLDTKLTNHANFVVRGKYLYAELSNIGNPLPNKKIAFKINGKTYFKTTNKNGRCGFKIKLAPASYSVALKYGGNNYYKSSQIKFNLRVMHYTNIDIANSKLLTNGYLRIYLKDYSVSDISHKTLKIKIANKKFTKKTDSEGIIVLKPNLDAKEYKVTVKYGKYWTSKKVNGIKGNVKDPLNESVPLKNGVPDIDLMPKNYVMADGSATYTLTKTQYKEVIKRDSYCLFLNNKLSKFTFFKTKSHPNTNHIVKREKWNVIERAINVKIVNANKYKYWPSKISVSLKGKSYTYSEVRDVQNTDYTCGPTSASVCSQVLRNYMSEKYLAKKAGSKEVIGTPCHGMIKALGNNFNCTYFYKNSFKTALDELKKGGCALIFHTKNHYVAILDISNNGKKVLVSNSYKTYYNIPTKWLTVNYMKTRFIKNHDDSLIVKLNYSLSNSTKNQVDCFYKSMGANWARHNTHATLGLS
ncbi:MAG: hypothetical protein IJ287_10360 [Methanobrevibacter sp.]|nr:hypothetical protein [Methanobrevibacter sp.]